MGFDNRFFQGISLPLPSSRGELVGTKKLAFLFLLLLPLALMVFKISNFPGAAYLRDALTLSGVETEIQDRVGYVLFVPLAAVIVVFFRVTLGIRLLGPFRSILLALAFHITGIPLGLLFLAVVVGIIVLIRPTLKSIRLPYFGRVSVVLSAVAALIVVVMVTAEWFQITHLHQVAYFPIVVLCLTGDGFARTLNREGLRSAMWRGAMTALAAVLITLLWQIPGFLDLLIRFPELLFLEIGLIIVIAEFLGFRLLQNLNPVPEKKSRKKRKNTKSKANKSKTSK